MNEYESYGDYSQREQREGGLNAASGLALLLIGFTAGAVTALLLAPRSGRETRDAISQRYRETVDGVSQRAQELRERGSEILERGSTLLGMARRRARRG